MYTHINTVFRIAAQVAAALNSDYRFKVHPTNKIDSYTANSILNNYIFVGPEIKHRVEKALQSEMLNITIQQHPHELLEHCIAQQIGEQLACDVLVSKGFDPVMVEEITISVGRLSPLPAESSDLPNEQEVGNG